MREVEVIIEIAKGSHIKYEYDKERNILICDRVLHTPMKYPFNYGFIPDTLSEDEDPLDAVVLMDDELVPGCIIRCKILGYLETKDDAGNDPKLLVCPVEKVDPMWKDIESIFSERIDNHLLEKIKYFFQHYKDLENKTVFVGELYDREEAINVYNQSVDRYKCNDSKYKNKNNNQKTKITNFFERI
jgi:inorganic pyrophosphatase